MELEVEDCEANRLDGAAVSSLSVGTTTQNTGCHFNTGSSTSNSAFYLEDKIVTSEEPCFNLEDHGLEDSTFDGSITSQEDNLEKMSSSTDLRPDFIRDLKRIRDIDYCIDFCSLLIKVEDSSCDDAQLSQISKMFLNYRDEIEQNHIDIVKTIQDALHVKESKEMSELKDSIKSSHFVCEITSEYLKGVSKIVKRLMEQFFNPDLHSFYFSDLVKQTEEGLPMLEKLLVKFASIEAYNVLFAMYSIGLEDLRFSEEDKKEINSLLLRSAKHIGKFIRNYALSAGSQLNLIDIEMRSSFQFFKDSFADLTDENVVKEIESSEAALNKMISCLYVEKNSDKPFVKATYYDDSDHSYDSDYSYHSDYEEDENEIIDDMIKMPEHHTWWGEYLRKYFKK